MTRAPDQAFLEFVKSRAAPLPRMAYLLCGDWHLADDLVQETLAKSFRHWHRVRRAENPDAYVRRMLINEARRHWRRNLKRRAGGKPSGDATLVIRNQSYPNQPAISAADLYTDSGEYFFAHSASGLPAQVTSDHNLGDGLFAREMAAAVHANHGDLATARERMAEAADPGHAPAPPWQVKKGPGKGSTVSPEDNCIWGNSLGALIAGSGKPQVRAGVLRILSTLPEVTLTSTTTGGQPTLTLRASAPAMPGNYLQTLVIGARTGIPVTFTGGVPGQAPDVTVTYQVTRVTLADIAAGKP